MADGSEQEGRTTKKVAKKVGLPTKKAAKAAKKAGPAPKVKMKGASGTKTPAPPPPRPALVAPPTDPLIVLGVREPLSQAQQRRAWRAYAAKHHPTQVVTR